MAFPGKRLRLFCFPYSGASIAIYYRWATRLPGFVDLCPVEIPGRGARAGEPAFVRIGPLADMLTRDLLPRIDGPFAVFGHSLGALVGYEVARRMWERHRARPVRLFVSGCRAPHCERRWAPTHDLPEPELLDRLRRLGGTPEEVLANADVMKWVLPTIRADFALYETYSYGGGKPLDCPISAFGGAADATTDVEEIVAWKEHTQADFTCRMLPGGHFFLNTEFETLLQAISHDLAAYGE